MSTPAQPSDALKARIRHHEGFRSDPYVDSLGHVTYGYGHKITPINKLSAERLLTSDLQIAFAHTVDLFSDVWRNLNQVRREVLVEMVFQMGKTGVSKFKRMRQALREEDYHTAGNEMVDSRWREQTPKRATCLAQLMRDGK